MCGKTHGLDIIDTWTHASIELAALLLCIRESWLQVSVSRLSMLMYFAVFLSDFKLEQYLKLRYHHFFNII